MANKTKIVIAGAGFAGSILARQLLKYTDADVSVFDKCKDIEESMTGTGLNVNPNAMTSLKSLDPELEGQLRAVGLPRQSMKAETMSGRIIYHEDIYNEQGQGLALNSGLRVRWADAYSTVRQGLPIQYNHEVVGYAVDNSKESGPITVRLLNKVTSKQTTVEGVDFLVGADGRYSKIREQISEANTTYIGVSNFRLLVPDTSGNLFEDMELIYNEECDKEKISGLNLSAEFNAAASSIPRIGIMKMPKVKDRPQMIYIFGNFGVEGNIPAEAKTAEGLSLLYTPKNGKISSKGAFILRTLQDNAANLHWARMQHTPPLFGDQSGKVLLLGDAAHAVVPTLGQGATLAIEDACVAAGSLIKALQNGGLGRDTISEIEEKRRDRRVMVSNVSIDASEHLMPQERSACEILKQEKTAWEQEEPGFREKMRSVWQDAPILNPPSTRREP